MPFHDLNIAYNADQTALSHTLLFAQELGYETVALSIAITSELPKDLPVVQVPASVEGSKIRILKRLTLSISDTSQNYRLSSLTPNYDLIALRPTNDKTLQQCCSSLECDIISIDFSQRLHYPFKFKTVSSALQRGIRFEISYSLGIVAGYEARRNLISGATQLIRATRGRGIIISSEARSALALRAPWDLINLAQVWGLSQQRAKEALCEEAGKVVRFAGMKRTSFRGVVDIIDGNPTLSVDELEKSAQTGNKIENRSSEKGKSTQALPLNGVKRKASMTSGQTIQPTEQPTGEPISKSKMKRLAKKARLEGKMASNIAKDDTLRALPL